MPLRLIIIFLFLLAAAALQGTVFAQPLEPMPIEPMEFESWELSPGFPGEAPQPQQDIIEEQPPPAVLTRVIVIDPGHGGLDLGVRSSKSILEKSVVMKLAKSISKNMKKYPGVRVILTREGDLERSALRRLEIANSSKADLYLGLHTGGGFTPQIRPVEIFIARNKTKYGSSGEWNSQNMAYSTANEYLAKSLTSQIKWWISDKEVRVVRTDGMMLEGLNMPAAIIEPVDLSNPQDEILLEDNDYLRKVARAISKGLAKYLDVEKAERSADE